MLHLLMKEKQHRDHFDSDNENLSDYTKNKMH